MNCNKFIFLGLIYNAINTGSFISLSLILRFFYDEIKPLHAWNFLDQVH